MSVGVKVDEPLTGRNPGKAQARDPVHLCRYPDAVPMDRSRRLQPIGDRNRNHVALAPAQRRSGHGTIDRNRSRVLPREVHPQTVDG